jgi:4'-phosphopantetheinyl transferase
VLNPAAPGQVLVAWTSTSHEETTARRESHALLARLVRRVVGHDVPVGRRCSRCGSTGHGAPVVEASPDLGTSLARTRGHAVAAVVSGARVGIDVERPDTDVDRLADVALGPHDAPAPTAAALLRTWVRKEAVLKAAGLGLAVDPSHVGLTAAGDPPRLVAWSSPDHPDPRPLTLLDLDARHGLPAGLVASLAVTGTSRGPVEVVPATSDVR